MNNKISVETSTEDDNELLVSGVKIDSKSLMRPSL